MALLGTLSVTLDANTEKLRKGLAGAQKRLEEFGERMQGVAVKAGAAFAGIAFASKKLVDAYGAQQAAEIKLASAIKATGAEIDIEKLKVYASALQQVTTVGDELTLDMQALLVTFGLSEEQLVAMTPAVIDFAAAMKVDLRSAALQVGKATQGMIGGLSRYGVTLSDAETRQFKLANQAERTALIINKLRAAFGGMAAKLAKTGTKAAEAASGAFGDMLETMGSLVEPQFIEAMKKLKGAFEAIDSALKKLGPDAKEAVGNVGTLITALTGGLTVFATSAVVLPKVTAAITGMATAMKTAAIASKALVKNIARLAAVALPAAGLAGMARVLAADRDELREISRAFGITKGGGLLQNWLRTAKGLVELGLEPLLDSARKLVDEFTTLGETDVSDTLAEMEKAIDEALGDIGKPPKPKPKDIEFDLDFSAIGAHLDSTLTGATDAFLRQVMHAGASATDNASMGFDGMSANAMAIAMVFEDVSAGIADAMDRVKAGLGDAAEFAAGEVEAVAKQGAPRLAAAIEAAQQGFAAAGPLGAVAGAAISIASHAESVQAAFGELDKIITPLVNVIDRVLEPLPALARAFAKFVTAVVKVLSAVTFLNPVLRLLRSVLGGLARAIERITETIVSVWNSLLENLADLVGKIPKFGGDLARRIRGAQIDLGEIGRELDAREPTQLIADGMASWRRGIDKAEDEIDKATASLTNVPRGFKIAAARFGAIQGDIAASATDTAFDVDDANNTLAEQWARAGEIAAEFNNETAGLSGAVHMVVTTLQGFAETLGRGTREAADAGAEQGSAIAAMLGNLGATVPTDAGAEQGSAIAAMLGNLGAMGPTGAPLGVPLGVAEGAALGGDRVVMQVGTVNVHADDAGQFITSMRRETDWAARTRTSQQDQTPTGVRGPEFVGGTP